MKRLMAVFCLILALLLCACGSGSPTPESITPAEVATPVPAEETAPAGAEDLQEEIPVEEQETQTETPEDDSWKQAYFGVLADTKSQWESQAEDPAVVNSYFVYDMNKDGIPELAVETGTCEADYVLSLYAFRDGEAAKIEEIGAGHTSFYGDRENKGLILAWGHMGYAETYRIVEENGAFTSETLYEDDLNSRLAEDPDAEYLPVTDFVPGAYPLTLVDADNPLPLTHYDEIQACLEGSTPTAESQTFPQGDPDFFTKLISSDATVTASGVDRFAKTPGSVGFQTLLKKDVAAEWMGGDLIVRSVQEADLNGDGQRECILSLTEENGEDPILFFLSEEDGTVYAYIQNYAYYEPSVSEDGSLLLSSEYYQQHCRLIFEKENSFLLNLPA